ncbi:MAG: flagellar motor protein MotB [SAR324 cluster bacterium]|nr:flagellar motor protein MotB [SAR324 cluster bacterium]MBF0351219.1 flagellar motor protein MotB [SAR324 cluster bacterium]
MGQMIDEEDCPHCEPFDQEWIFTYGDLVTLLLCFFILLFSMCKMDNSKFKDVAQSFKPMPSGSPFITEGQDSVVEQLAKELEDSELAEDTQINVDERGVVVSFSANAFFDQDSTELNAQAREELERFAKLLYILPNKIQVEGHTDQVESTQWRNQWEISGARAAVVGNFLTTAGINGKKITVKGFGWQRPKAANDTPQQRALNNRVEVILVPE